MKSTGFIYVIAAMFMLMFLWLAVRYDGVYGSIFTTIGIGMIILLLMIGQVIELRKKVQLKEKISSQIWIIIGLILVFLVRVVL